MNGGRRDRGLGTGHAEHLARAAGDDRLVVAAALLLACEPVLRPGGASNDAEAVLEQGLGAAELEAQAGLALLAAGRAGEASGST